jgi:hypothetical protein
VLEFIGIIRRSFVALNQVSEFPVLQVRVLWQVPNILDVRYVPSAVVALNREQPSDYLLCPWVITHSELHEVSQREPVAVGRSVGGARRSRDVPIFRLPFEDPVQCRLDMPLGPLGIVVSEHVQVPQDGAIRPPDRLARPPLFIKQLLFGKRPCPVASERVQEPEPRRICATLIGGLLHHGVFQWFPQYVKQQPEPNRWEGYLMSFLADSSTISRISDDMWVMVLRTLFRNHSFGWADDACYFTLNRSVLKKKVRLSYHLWEL